MLIENTMQNLDKGDNLGQTTPNFDDILPKITTFGTTFPKPLRG